MVKDYRKNSAITQMRYFNLEKLEKIMELDLDYI